MRTSSAVLSGLVLAAALLTACGASDIYTPRGEFAMIGTYTLESRNGVKVPVPYEYGILDPGATEYRTCRWYIESSSIQLRADSTYTGSQVNNLGNCEGNRRETSSGSGTWRPGPNETVDFDFSAIPGTAATGATARVERLSDRITLTIVYPNGEAPGKPMTDVYSRRR